jgi:acyl carrier protein
MLRMAETSRHDRIAGIVVGLLAQRHKAGKPGPEDDLRQAGLTSLDMVKLVLSLEQEFDAAIPEKAIIPANFRSINAIAGLIGTVQSAP